MFEPLDDLLRLQELLDESYAAAGASADHPVSSPGVDAGASRRSRGRQRGGRPRAR